jgi:hypothetical protein
MHSKQIALNRSRRIQEVRKEIMRIEKVVARIFSEPTGKFYVCDNSLDYLDARGRAYETKRQAIAGIKDPYGPYTHYLSDSGKIVKIK